MKTFPLIVLSLVAAASSLVTPLALACPDGRCVFAQPPGDAETDQLLTQADALDATAASNESSAASFEQQANKLTARVKSLRSLAAQIDDPGKSELLVEAAGIEAQASNARSRAGQLRAHATDLRASARELRQIAQERNEARPPRPVVGGPPVAVPPTAT